jgi:phage gpG-like protein
MSAYKNFISLEVTGIEEALAKVGPAFVGKIKNTLTETMTLKDIGTTLMASAVKTINAGGRPAAYKPLAASTIARRAKEGKGSTKPLVHLGTMRQSLDYEVTGGALYLTSVDYLKYHQFEENRIKARFPARPVWGVQEEDQAEIRDAIVAGIKRNL